MSNKKNPKRRRGPEKRIPIGLDGMPVFNDDDPAIVERRRALALQVAARMQEQALAGQDIAGTSLKEQVGDVLLNREPTFFLHPTLQVRLPIKIVTYTKTDPATGLAYEHSERDRITVDGVTCPICNSVAPMEGWNLDSPPGSVIDRVVQCSNCRHYHFMEAGKRGN